MAVFCANAPKNMIHIVIKNGVHEFKAENNSHSQLLSSGI